MKKTKRKAKKNLKERLRNQKGITLISLVITIIVLLILAGVAISVATNSDGIFGKAGKATNDWNDKVAEEEGEFDNLMGLLYPAEGISLNKTTLSLSLGDTEQLTAIMTPEESPNTNLTWSTDNNAVATVDETGKVTAMAEGTATITVATKTGDQTATCEVTVIKPTTITTNLPTGWNSANVSAVATQGTRTAPIPTGFVASEVNGENTISGGLVIYKGTDAVNSTNHATALTSRDQYVWIPVDEIEDMIMCQSKTYNTTCNLETQADGSLKCTTHNSTKLAGRLYMSGMPATTDSNGSIIYKYPLFFTLNDQTYSANSGYREPAVVTGRSNGNGEAYDGSSDNYHGLGSANAFLTQLQDDFNRMAQSVAKYKGFYISRYEVGTGGNSRKDQTVMTARTNSQMWYGLYNTLRSDPDVTAPTYSQMIWR